VQNIGGGAYCACLLFSGPQAAIHFIVHGGGGRRGVKWEGGKFKDCLKTEEAFCQHTTENRL
jgi:hypothetical protein